MNLAGGWLEPSRCFPVTDEDALGPPQMGTGDAADPKRRELEHLCPDQSS